MFDFEAIQYVMYVYIFSKEVYPCFKTCIIVTGNDITFEVFSGMIMCYQELIIFGEVYGR